MNENLSDISKIYKKILPNAPNPLVFGHDLRLGGIMIKRVKNTIVDIEDNSDLGVIELRVYVIKVRRRQKRSTRYHFQLIF